MLPRGHPKTYPSWGGHAAGSYSNPDLDASLQLKLPPRTLASEKKKVHTVTLRSSGPEVYVIRRRLHDEHTHQFWPASARSHHAVC